MNECEHVIVVDVCCNDVLGKKKRKKSRCVTGPRNILFAGASVHLSTRKFYRLGQ